MESVAVRRGGSLSIGQYITAHGGAIALCNIGLEFSISGAYPPILDLESTMGIAGQLASAMNLIGIDAMKTVRSLRGVQPYIRNRATFRKQMEGTHEAEFAMGKPYPCLSDRYENSGVATGHYFHQDLYVAQLIFDNRPLRHVDVGSRVDGFVAHVAAFREIEVFDIRDLKVSVKNIVFRQRDIMQTQPELDGYTDSLSCLHALEHFGLGRYGDPVDFDGYRRGWENLYRMLATGGKFYFATPIGPQRIEFDAHRVFAVPFLLDMMRSRYRIDSVAYVNDEGNLVRGADADGPGILNSFGCSYGCGIFELTKH